jgi:DNA-directed RNA polymerase alpha subunit
MGTNQLKLPFELNSKALLKNLFRRVDGHEFSVRTKNLLQREKITYVGELVQKTEAELLKSRNFGQKSLKEIKDYLEQYGLKLGLKIPDWQILTAEQLIEEFYELLEAKYTPRVSRPAVLKSDNKTLGKLLLTVEELDLSVRALNCLKRLKIEYVGDLIQKPRIELLKMRNFGRTSLAEINEKLAQLGLCLGMSVPDWTPESRGEQGLFSIELDRSATPPKLTAPPKLDDETLIKLLRGVEELDLSARSSKVLKRLNIKFIGDLVQKTVAELLKTRNFGRTSLAEINKKLAQLGLCLGMSVPDWTPENIEKGLTRFAKELKEERIREAEKFRQEYGVTPNILEEELGLLTTLTETKRNREIVTRLLGWDGRGAKTLQTVGREFGITRERVRQIRDKFYKRLEGKKKAFHLPILNRVLEFVAEESPGLANEIEEKLVDHSLAKGPFRLEGLLTAAEAFGLKVPFRIVELRKKRIVVSPEANKVPGLIVKVARKIVGKRGVATISDIAAQVQEKTGQPITTDFVASTLSLLKGFHWLDKTGGWFWLSSVPTGRNRLLNVIEKILSVVDDGIDIAELRSGVGRFHRMEGFAPPRRVLLELCKMLSWCRVEGNMITADPKLDWEDVLAGDNEWIICGLLKENESVMAREELEKICFDLGMGRASFQMIIYNSPIITKHAIGVYGIRGAKISPGKVKSVKPKLKPKKVIKDFGWMPDGKIWIGLKLSQGVLNSGVFGIPAGMKEHLQGDFSLKAADGAYMGSLKVKDSSAWSLSKLFRRRGGEPGDYLVLKFDTTSREATAYIGDEDLLDEFRPE